LGGRRVDTLSKVQGVLILSDIAQKDTAQKKKKDTAQKKKLEFVREDGSGTDVVIGVLWWAILRAKL